MMNLVFETYSSAWTPMFFELVVGFVGSGGTLSISFESPIYFALEVNPSI